MFTDPLFYLVGLPTVLIMSISKGAFGGGLAIVGVPFLSLVMSPIEAAIVVAPLVSFMDLFALNTFGPKTWSKPDLAWLVPGLFAGIALGYAFFALVDPRLVNLGIGAVTVAFAADYFLRGRLAPAGGRRLVPPIAMLAGTASGFTTFVAHAGGPPAQMYLLSRGLNKTVFAGTNLALFTLGNFVKLIPYGLLAWAQPRTLLAAMLLAPAVPIGVWAGVWLHERLEQRRLFLWCYVILTFAAVKLVFDAAFAYFG
ncbi:MAG: sulfite exporter TauE/SafE family protein [Xanthobacteraceae bacterium]